MPNSHRKNGSRSYSKGATRLCMPVNLDGRLAYDIVEAALILRTVKRLDSKRTTETRKRAKINAITLHRAPWD